VCRERKKGQETGGDKLNRSEKQVENKLLQTEEQEKGDRGSFYARLR
jgi:hypothetical protein